MKLTLRRFKFTQRTTLGELLIDGRHHSYVIEDRYRPPPEKKVPGETCIPIGTYNVVINRSERFSKLAGHDVLMPLLENVPGFTGIRIHTGNKHEDTEGCLLPGLTFAGSPATGYTVQQSKTAYDRLFIVLAAAQARKERITIDVVLDAGAPLAA